MKSNVKLIGIVAVGVFAAGLVMYALSDNSLVKQAQSGLKG